MATPNRAPNLSPSNLSAIHVPAVWQRGKAPLFLIHGWGNTHACWQPLLTDLARDRDLFLLDLPGFGINSEYSLLGWEETGLKGTSLKSTSLEDTLDQIARLLPEPCILVGWSLGGHLALRLAARNPHTVIAVVTLATNASFVASADWPQAMPAAIFDSFRQQFSDNPATTLSRFCGLQAQGDQDARNLFKILREQCVPPQPEQLGQWRNALDWLAQLDHRSELPRIATPLLHLFGDQDALVPIDAARAMTAVSPGEVQVIANAGHAFHLSQSDQVRRQLQSFLNRVDQRRVSLQLDKKRVAESFSRAAETYDGAAHLQTQVGRLLSDLLPEPSADEAVLDLGCGTGFCTEILLPRKGCVMALDIAPGMLKKAREKVIGEVDWLCADGEFLPFHSGSFSGTMSNLTIQWSENLPRLFGELARVTQEGGWLLFSTLGPATLSELRSAWRRVDEYTHVNTFVGADELRAALVNAGFEASVFREEVVVPHYRQVSALMRELKDLGAHNVNAQQNPGLTGPRQLRRLSRAYERFRQADGTLPATYQVFLVLARKPVKTLIRETTTTTE